MSKSLACRLCSSMIACPKEEVDAFLFKLGQELSGLSSPPAQYLDASTYCVPCLESARNAPAPPPPAPPSTDSWWDNNGRPVRHMGSPV